MVADWAIPTSTPRAQRAETNLPRVTTMLGDLKKTALLSGARLISGSRLPPAPVEGQKGGTAVVGCVVVQSPRYTVSAGLSALCHACHPAPFIYRTRIDVDAHGTSNLCVFRANAIVLLHTFPFSHIHARFSMRVQSDAFHKREMQRAIKCDRVTRERERYSVSIASV